MKTRDQVVAALHVCLDYIQATSDIDGIWEVNDQESLDNWRKARDEVTEVVRAALAADNAARN